ncbi:MAG: tripartite tricarboxylate transporter TctB family protein [Oceanospirillaceae bacterium]|nr:tripartite tricarboxylate transporter TctB family protein [Oceanospirillaceae bacterium]
MSLTLKTRLTRPLTVTSLILMLVALSLLPMALELNDVPSLLPVTMLLALAGLSLIAIVGDQRQALHQGSTEPLLKAPLRVYGALCIVFLYIGSVHLLGFYPTTCIFVPLIAYLFGCKSPKTLVVATLLVPGLIYLIFGLAMSKEFPSGLIWG